MRGDEAELFARHARELERAVGRRVSASHATVEDACAFAWAQLLDHQPERGPTIFAWLRTTAVHEAWRLTGQTARAPGVDEHDLSLLAGGRGDDATLEAREALECVAALGPRPRQVLTHLVAGLSYDEIAAATGQTRRTVDRQLRRAREGLLEIRAEGGENRPPGA